MIYNPSPNLISNLAERGFVGWIFKGPVKPLRFSRKNRADFVSVVADRDDLIEFLASEFINGF